MSNDPREEARAAIKQSEAAARKGDLAAAERWSKVAERLVAAAEREAALPAPAVENEEELRAEIRDRILRLAEAAMAVQAWEAERDLYEANLAAALANGSEPPPPLRPHPHGEAYEVSEDVSSFRGSQSESPEPRGGQSCAFAPGFRIARAARPE